MIDPLMGEDHKKVTGSSLYAKGKKIAQPIKSSTVEDNRNASQNR